VIGIQALRRIHAAGAQRQQLGAVLEGTEPTALGFHWHEIRRRGQRIGHLTNCVWSYRLRQNIGFALVAAECAPGDAVEIIKDARSLA
jgi:glycine cleavage system aminomethyltransferase T